MRVLIVVATMLVVISSAGLAFADPSDAVLTNAAQLAEQGFADALYLPWFVPSVWQAFPTAGQPTWIDLSQFPKEFAALWNSAEQGAYGVKIVRIKMTRDVLSGETWIDSEASGEQLAYVPAPAKYQPSAGQDTMALRMWKQMKDCPECWGVSADEIPPPVVTMRLTVADANDLPGYLAAEEAAWEQAEKEWAAACSASSGGGMAMMMMSSPCPENETNDFQISSITYDPNALTATIMFPSCSTRIYSVESTDDLLTNTVWSFRQSLIGLDGSTAWDDPAVSGIDHRFYRAWRYEYGSDSDADGLTAYQEALYGTDPRSPTSTVYGAQGVLDGPYNNVTPAVWTNLFSSLSGVPGVYLANTNRWFALDPSIPTAAPFKTVNVQTNVYAGSGDSTNEVFEVSSRGRILPYASGGNASNGFGRIDGGIYFNHDSSNLYVGVAGLVPGNDNALLIFLDTTGGQVGGVTNLANIGTLTGPFALTKAHNLSFDATNFTPTVGIIVGDKRRDGRNFANAVFVGNDFGQGVYRLQTNTVTDLGTFNQTGGCGISQWGDLQTTQPGDPANTNSANAGVQITIRKSDLGLTNATVFKAAAIFSGGTDGNNRYFSAEAYGKSINGTRASDGNFGFNATTLIGSSVYLSSNAAPPFTPVSVGDGAVMMQGFYWNVPDPGLCSTYAPGASDFYAELASKAADMSTNGVTAVWMPPPSKGKVGNYSTGYDPNDHYDLGQSVNTRYGSFTELTNVVAVLSATGIAAYVDIVMNHMTGDSNVTVNDSGYFTNNASGHFYKTPADFYATNDWFSPPFHLLTTFAPDHFEVNQTAPHMRLGLEAWGEWLTSTVGYQGYRFDHSLGIEPWYQAEWLEMPMMSNKFAVLEYIGSLPVTKRELQTWINLVDQRASLFDFMLHDNFLTNMCGSGSFNMATLTNAGLVAIAPQFTVTYVESHDTIRPPCDCASQGKSAENGLLGVTANKTLAYAFILISQGYPVVQYHDYYYAPYRTNIVTCPSTGTWDQNFGFKGSPLKPQIDKLISARKRFAFGTTAYLPQTQGNSQDVYIAKRNASDGYTGCILVINRATTNVNVTVGTGWASTNVMDYVGNFGSFTTGSNSNGMFTALATNYAVYVVQQP